MPRKGPISGKTLYTAEEYLKMSEYRIKGRLKRELSEIERSMNEKKKKQKTIKASSIFLY